MPSRTAIRWSPWPLRRGSPSTCPVPCPTPLYEELTPICVVAEDPNVLAVAASSDWQTFDDFVNYAKGAGASCTIASTSKGGSNEFFTYGLADVVSYEFTYVPYDGGSKSRTAVLGGENDAVVCQVSEIKALVDSGEMRVLGVSSAERVSYIDAPPPSRSRAMISSLACTAPSGPPAVSTPR